MYFELVKIFDVEFRCPIDRGNVREVITLFCHWVKSDFETGFSDVFFLLEMDHLLQFRINYCF